MQIALDQAMEVIRREPELINALFTQAYQHSYVRDDTGTNITQNPRRVMVFYRTVVVLSQQSDQLIVESVSPLPETFEKAPLTERSPSVEECVQMLTFSRFHVIASDLVSFRYFGQRFVCRFSSDYARWFLRKD